MTPPRGGKFDGGCRTTRGVSTRRSRIMVTATDQFDDDTPLATDLQQFAYLARTIQSEQSKYVRGHWSAVGPFRRIQRGCRLGNVRFVPKAPKPSQGQGRCVWPDACDSNSQTGGSNHAPSACIRMGPASPRTRDSRWEGHGAGFCETSGRSLQPLSSRPSRTLNKSIKLPCCAVPP